MHRSPFALVIFLVAVLPRVCTAGGVGAAGHLRALEDHRLTFFGADGTVARGVNLADDCLSSQVVSPDGTLVVEVAPPGEAAPSPAAPDPLAWVEVVPLDHRAAAEIRRVDPRNATLSLPAGNGTFALVCTGTAGWAVGCERRELGGDKKISLEAVPGTRLGARLLADREPVAGAEVRVFPADLDARRAFVMALGWDAKTDRPRRAVRSDEEGRFELPPLAAGRYHLEIAAPWGRVEQSEAVAVPAPEEMRRRRAPVDARGNPLLDLGDLPLHRGVTVEFQVSDQSGRPLAGATVGGAQDEADGRFSLLGVTDRDGRARLAGAEPGLPFRARCSADGHRPLDLDHPRPPAVVVCRLDAHAAVAGRVVADGEPLPGATLELVERQAFAPGRWSLASDADGRFAQPGLPAGVYRLSAAASGFTSWSEAFELAPGESLELTEIELLPAPEAHGRVVDAASGEAVAGAQVAALSPPGAVAATSDAEGRFVFHHPGGEALVLRVEAAGYPAHPVAVPADASFGEEPFEIRLPRGGQLRVVVWDEAADAPCAGCPVIAYQPLAAGMPEGETVSLTTGADGVAASGLLPPGEYHVVPERVRSTGSTVEVRSGASQQSARVLPEAVTEVVFGRPAVELAVRFWPPPAGFSLLADGRRGRRTAEAGADGVFRLRRGADEALVLRLARPGLTLFAAILPADHRGTDLDLDLPRTRVRGRLAVGAAEVRLRALAEPAVGAWTLAAGDGSFAVPHLPPGVYAVESGGRDLATFTLAAGADLDLGLLPAAGGAPAER